MMNFSLYTRLYIPVALTAIALLACVGPPAKAQPEMSPSKPANEAGGEQGNPDDSSASRVAIAPFYSRLDSKAHQERARALSDKLTKEAASRTRLVVLNRERLALPGKGSPNPGPKPADLLVTGHTDEVSGQRKAFMEVSDPRGGEILKRVSTALDQHPPEKLAANLAREIDQVEAPESGSHPQGLRVGIGAFVPLAGTASGGALADLVIDDLIGAERISLLKRRDMMPLLIEQRLARRQGAESRLDYGRKGAELTVFGYYSVSRSPSGPARAIVHFNVRDRFSRIHEIAGENLEVVKRKIVERIYEIARTRTREETNPLKQKKADRKYYQAVGVDPNHDDPGFMARSRRRDLISAVADAAAGYTSPEQIDTNPETYREVLKLDPNHHAARLMLAATLIIQNDFRVPPPAYSALVDVALNSNRITNPGSLNAPSDLIKSLRPDFSNYPSLEGHKTELDPLYWRERSIALDKTVSETSGPIWEGALERGDDHPAAYHRSYSQYLKKYPALKDLDVFSDALVYSLQYQNIVNRGNYYTPDLSAFYGFGFRRPDHRQPPESDYLIGIAGKHYRFTQEFFPVDISFRDNGQPVLESHPTRIVSADLSRHVRHAAIDQYAAQVYSSSFRFELGDLVLADLVEDSQWPKAWSELLLENLVENGRRELVQHVAMERLGEFDARAFSERYRKAISKYENFFIKNGINPYGRISEEIGESVSPRVKEAFRVMATACFFGIENYEEDVDWEFSQMLGQVFSALEGKSTALRGHLVAYVKKHCGRHYPYILFEHPVDSTVLTAIQREYLADNKNNPQFNPGDPHRLASGVIDSALSLHSRGDSAWRDYRDWLETVFADMELGDLLRASLEGRSKGPSAARKLLEESNKATVRVDMDGSERRDGRYAFARMGEDGSLIFTHEDGGSDLVLRVSPMEERAAMRLPDEVVDHQWQRSQGPGWRFRWTLGEALSETDQDEHMVAWAGEVEPGCARFTTCRNQRLQRVQGYPEPPDVQTREASRFSSGTNLPETVRIRNLFHEIERLQEKNIALGEIHKFALSRSRMILQAREKIPGRATVAKLVSEYTVNPTYLPEVMAELFRQGLVDEELRPTEAFARAYHGADKDYAGIISDAIKHIPFGGEEAEDLVRALGDRLDADWADRAVVVRTGYGQWTVENRLTPTDGQAGLDSVTAVSIDGGRAALCAELNAKSGGGFVFEKSTTGSWGLKEKITANSCSLAAIDRDWLGLRIHDGEFRLYRDEPSAYSRQQLPDTAEAPRKMNSRSEDVAMHDGILALASGSRDNLEDPLPFGGISLFGKASDAWTLLQRIPQPFGNNFVSGFGAALALKGDYLVAGAPNAQGPGGHQGSGVVMVYKKTAGRWEAVNRIVPPKAEEVHGLGQSVHILGPRVLISTGHSLLDKGAKVFYAPLVPSTEQRNGRSALDRLRCVPSPVTEIGQPRPRFFPPLPGACRQQGSWFLLRGHGIGRLAPPDLQRNPDVTPILQPTRESEDRQ